MIRTVFALAAALCVCLVVAPAAAQDEKKVADVLAQSEELYEQGEYGEAAALLREAREQIPDFRLLYHLGKCAAAAEQHEAALEAYEAFLSEGGDQIPSEKRWKVKIEVEKLKQAITVKEEVSAVEQALDEDMDDLWESYHGSEVERDMRFSQYVLRKSRRMLASGIVLTTFGLAFTLGTVAFSFIMLFEPEIFVPIFCVQVGLSLSTLITGIFFIARGARRVKGVKSMLDEETQSALGRMQLSVLTDSHGRPGGLGLSFAF